MDDCVFWLDSLIYAIPGTIWPVTKELFSGQLAVGGCTSVVSLGHWVIVGFLSRFWPHFTSCKYPGLFYLVLLGLGNSHSRVTFFHSRGLIAWGNLGETQWEWTESNYLLSVPSSQPFSKDPPFLTPYSPVLGFWMSCVGKYFSPLCLTTPLECWVIQNSLLEDGTGSYSQIY